MATTAEDAENKYLGELELMTSPNDHPGIVIL